MKHEINIGHLIQNFNLGNVSREELKILVTYFKKHEPENELLAIYQKAWENAMAGNTVIDTEKEYSIIIDKINRKPANQINRTAGFRELWKYAAIFVMAFSLSWMVNNLFNKENKEISQQTFQNIEVPYGSKSKIELPDGSKVTLNSGSRLRYETGLGNDTRTVYLEGEAFFDVKKDTTRPFYVNASGLKIKVLGTSFNVKAYPEEKTIETTLVTGKVEIFKAGSKEKTPVATLMPSQKAIFEKEAGSIALQEHTDEPESIKTHEPVTNFEIKKGINTKLSIAWKDNQFVFDNERFEDLITKIERWYNVEITLDYPGLKEARFSGKFDKETIEQALKALTFVTPFHYKIEKNKITIIK